jgi:hypothetical protein
MYDHTSQAVADLHAAIVNVVPIQYGPYATADRIVGALERDGVVNGFDLEVLTAALESLSDKARLAVARHFTPFAEPALTVVSLGLIAQCAGGAA